MKLLDRLISPLPAETFLLNYYSRRPVRLAGTVDRFADLNAETAADWCRALEYSLEAPVALEFQRPQPGPEELLAGSLFVIQLRGNSVFQVKRSDSEDLEIRLSAGDVLYVPRNFKIESTSAQPDGQLARFLVHSLTGFDLLRSIVRNAKDAEAMRDEVPVFSGPGAIADHLDRVRNVFLDAAQDPYAVLRMVRHGNRDAKPLDPPLSVTAVPTIHLLSSRRPPIRRAANGALRIPFKGGQLHFPEDAAPVLHYLIDHCPVAVSDFREFLTPDFDPEELEEILQVLTREGLIGISEPHAA